MSRIFLCIAFGVLTTFGTRSAEVVSPNDVGLPNSSGGEVFTLPNSIAPSARAQQVYGAVDFASVGAPELLINEISFRVGPGPFETQFLQNVEIGLSTTMRNPDGLSATYDSNLGAGEMVVYSGGFVFVPSFDSMVHIHLQTPFLYDPRMGNLLLDVKNFETALPTRIINPPLEAYDIMGDTTSTVYGYDVNSPTASFVTSKGLSTVFTYTPVPEPSIGVFILAGLILAGLSQLKKFTRAGTAMT